MAIVALVTIAILIVWSIQAGAMRRNFTDSIRNGDILYVPPNLAGKKWTDDEIKSARVYKLDDATNIERAGMQNLHSGSEYTISPFDYSYEAIITDESTGIAHIFGYRRIGQTGWIWATIHPDSTEEWIRLRVGTPGENANTSE